MNEVTQGISGSEHAIIGGDMNENISCEKKYNKIHGVYWGIVNDFEGRKKKVRGKGYESNEKLKKKNRKI